MATRRVVVTGMGLKSPVGNTVAEAWDNILSGRSGIGQITRYDTEKFKTKIAGEIRDFEITDYLTAKDARKMDPFIHYGMAASIDAMRDSGLDLETENLDRIGVGVGSGIGGIGTIENTRSIYDQFGPRKISPFFVPSTIINMIAGNLSIHYGLTGPNLSMVTACSTATHNIGLAQRLISYGDADVMIVGAGECSTTPVAMGGFSSARALSTRNDDPHGASRPWDRDRDGFVLSDGAGVVVVEELEHASRRGARIYAELVGFGMSGDAHHITSPRSDGDGAARCMKMALNDAGLNPGDIAYINAHGTSTEVGDLAESRAVEACFGDEAFKLAMSSTKSMTGHLLGAAGGIEAIFTILAMRDGVFPPTINLDNPGEGCNLDYVPGTAREQKFKYGMSNSFGFGGTNGTLIFGPI